MKNKSKTVTIYRLDGTSFETEIEKKVVILKNKGYSSKDVSVILSLLFDVNKNLIYKIASEK